MTDLLANCIVDVPKLGLFRGLYGDMLGENREHFYVYFSLLSLLFFFSDAYV